jgi:hypothetical protein
MSLSFRRQRLSSTGRQSPLPPWRHTAGHGHPAVTGCFIAGEIAPARRHAGAKLVDGRPARRTCKGVPTTSRWRTSLPWQDSYAWRRLDALRIAGIVHKLRPWRTASSARSAGISCAMKMASGAGCASDSPTAQRTSRKSGGSSGKSSRMRFSTAFDRAAGMVDHPQGLEHALFAGSAAQDDPAGGNSTGNGAHKSAGHRR